MKTFKQYLSEMKKPRYEVPAEPGSTPTPEGQVKLYHQTDGRNISSIRKKGIESRQPVEGPKGIYASAPDKSSGRGFYGHPNDTPTIEFHVDKDEYSAPFVHRDKVEPKKIVAAHKPWHSTVRYIDADPDLRRDIENDKDGEYSRMIKDPNNRGDKTIKGVRFVMKRAKAQKSLSEEEIKMYDHKLEGIKDVHGDVYVRHHVNNEGRHIYTVHHQGNKIATAKLSGQDHYVSDVDVRPEFQRKGIATKLYDFIEKHSGKPLKPSPMYQTDGGKALWKKRNSNT